MEHRGTVVSIRGSVVDVRFQDKLPAIRHVLRAGDDDRVRIEVAAHLDAHVVRGIALTPTQGLSRGSSVLDTGQPFTVPVGKILLGRVFSVFGENIDNLPQVEATEYRPIHSLPVPISQQSTSSEIFETGIKAIDVLSPLERGGKAGLFGGAGVGKRFFSPS